jgi:hypothetical protein
MSHNRFGTTVTEDEMRALDVDLDRVWHGISGELWAAPTGWLERQATRLLRSPALARALCTTPSLLLSWILASVAVFALGILVANATDEPIVPLLAPAIAGVAVAFAYGAGADPAYEIARTMPIPARMILLVRVSVVFITNALLGSVAMLVAPSISGVTLLWLLPMVAISLLGLAVAVVSHSATVGGSVALAVWGAIVLGADVASKDVASAVSEAMLRSLAPLYLVITVAALVVTLWMSGDSAKRRELAGWW